MKRKKKIKHSTTISTWTHQQFPNEDKWMAASQREEERESEAEVTSAGPAGESAGEGAGQAEGQLSMSKFAICQLKRCQGH